MAIKLSQTAAKNLKQNGKNQWITDATVTGLQLRITAKGTKTWWFQYTLNGKTQRYSIGEFPSTSYMDAAEQAARLRDQVKEGKDPKAVAATPGQTTAKTLSDVLLYYRSLVQNASQFDNITRELLEKHGKVTIADFTPFVMKHYIEDKYKDRPGSGETLIAYVRAAYNKAAHPFSSVVLPVGTVNPATRLKEHIPLVHGRKKGSYAVVFEENEWARILDAMDRALAGEVIPQKNHRMHPIAVYCAKLCMLTGARPNEIVSLKADEIEDFTLITASGQDMSGKRIIKEAHKTWRKTGRPRQILVPPLGVETLEEAAKTRKGMNYEGPYIFPSPGRGKNRSPKYNRKGNTEFIGNIHNYVENIGLLAGMKLMPYNFRSAYINFALDNGVPIEVVAENVGHSDIRTTLKYYQRNRMTKLVEGANAVDDAFKKMLNNT